MARTGVRSDVAERGTAHIATAAAPRWQRFVTTAFTEIPDRLILLFLCACITVTALLFARVFQPYLAIGVTLVLFAVTWQLAPRWRVRPHSAVGAAVALELVGAWVWVNAPYYQQMLGVYRDPSIYALRGWWLTQHSSPLVDMTASLQGTVGVAGATVQAGGFPMQGHEAIPQGASLVPGLLAVAGRIGGLRAMLAANLVIGAVALLFVYALARRLMGPIWALVPMVSLAVCMPMVYFARASYTEPTALAAVFGGLVFLVVAFRRRRGIDFFLAGFVIGISTLARADGILAVDGALFAAGVAAGVAVEPAVRREYRRGFLLLAAGGLITSLLGWADLKLNSSIYYGSVIGDVRLLFIGFAVVLVAGLVASLVPLQRLRELISAHRTGIAVAGAVIIAGVCAIMISRPLWWTAHQNTSPIGISALAGRQKSLGLPLDPTRSYDEHTVNWLAWYLTWPLVVLAGIGFAVMAFRVVRRRDGRALAVLGLVGVVSILYLNRVAITPDQIWGSRRLLPVILPGVVLAAGYATWRAARSRTWRWAAVPLAVFVALAPALQWRHLFMQPEFGGELAAVDSACAAVSQVAGSGDRYAVVAGGVPNTGYWAPAMRIICGAAVVRDPGPTAAALARVRSDWGNHPVTVLTFDSSSVSWMTGRPPAPRFSGPVQLWLQPLTGRPTGTTSLTVQFWVGTLMPDGRVAPLAAGG